MTAKKSCLIVDDSDVICEIVTRILADLGLEGDAAPTADQAIEFCKEKRPEVVFLDWDLPSMGALDFLRAAAELDDDQKPIIVLCATENDHQQFTLAKAAGAAHHILKPFDKHTVATKLGEIGIIGASDVPVPVETAKTAKA